MIQIQLTPEKLIVKGHANAGPKGYDIVCAGVSALVNTLALALKGTGAEYRFFKDGFVAKLDSLSHDQLIVLAAIYKGLSVMASEYPAYIEQACNS